MSLKRNMLSIAASAILCGNVYAGSNTVYVPLTSDTKDNSWVLFGVNGFTDGVTTATGATTAAGNPTFSSAETLQITAAQAAANTLVSGIQDAAGAGANDMVTLRSVEGTEQIDIAIDVSSVGIVPETEPFRSMYVKIEDTDSVILMNYKASLEGFTLELKNNDDNTTIYSTTIDSTKTWNNMAIAGNRDVEDENDDDETVAPDLTDVVDVIDFDLSNNPITQSVYSDSINKDSAPVGSKARFYTYDSVSQRWNLFDIANSGIANDFEKFEKGRAYWGTIDDGDNNSSVNGNNKAGLILGTDTDDESIYEGKLSEGWNMLSFNAANNRVINAATGLIVAFDPLSDGDNFSIWDNTLTQSVTVTFTIALDYNTPVKRAGHINRTIEAAKLNGTMPKDFNLRAIPETGGSIVFISDRKFAIKDSGADCLAGVTTLTGGDVFDLSTSALTATSNVSNNGVSSVYGEYALIINPLVGDGTAAELDDDVAQNKQNNSAALFISNSLLASTDDKLFYANPSLDSGADGANQSTVTKLVTDLADSKLLDGADSTDGVGLATQLDIDSSGTVAGDMILIASDKPFYIKDNTFARTYQFESDTVNNYNIAVQSPGISDNVAIDVNTTRDEAIDLINAKADQDAEETTDGVYAAAGTNADEIVVVSILGPKVQLVDTTDTSNGDVDLLTEIDNTADVSKGLVKEVYSLDKIAQVPMVKNLYKIKGLAIGDVDGNAVDINVTHATATNVTDTVTETDKASKLAFFDDVVSEINNQMQELTDTNATIAGSATHDYTTAADPLFADVTVKLEGYNISGLALTIDGTDEVITDSNVASLDKLDSLSGYSMIADLKYNAINTPNYVSDGPLYTMKKAGYDVSAILTGTTNLDTGKISWTNLDLTKPVSEWFDNNEFNLFDVNDYAGYWVYLTENGTDDKITFESVTITPQYSYAFDTAPTVDDTYETVNSIDSGTFTVTVDVQTDSPDDEITPEVTAAINGTELELIRSATGNYSATLSKYEIGYLTEGNAALPVTITATDGKGSSKTYDATIDYLKPATPTISIVQGKATLSSTSADVGEYYYFDSVIPETSIEQNSIKAYGADSTDVDGYYICQDTDFANTVKTYRAVAVDGSGVFGSANVSDILNISYINMIKEAHILKSTGTGANEAVATGDLYDSECKPVTAPVDDNGNEANYGISVKSIVSGTVASLSYKADLTVEFDTAGVITEFFDIGDDVSLVQVKHISAYNGDTFYIEIDGSFYSGTFGTADTNEGSPVELVPVAATVTAQSFE